MARKSTAKKKTGRVSISKQPAFLAAFSAYPNLTAAAAAAGIDRTRHYRWLNDPKYAAKFEAAKTAGVQSLVDLAVERAVKGVFEPTVFRGQFTYPREQYELYPAVPARDWKDEGGIQEARPAVMAERDVPGAPPIGIWKLSEQLHRDLLRAWSPAFKQQVELTGKEGGPIEIADRILAARKRAAAIQK